MTEERKAEIVADIVAAFRSKGLKPCFGDYTRPGQACAIGVVTKPDYRLDQFAARYNVSREFAWGVISGFDDEGLAAGGIDTWHGHDVGQRIRRTLLGGGS